MELYFFRNVSNYDELKEKTVKACRIKSINKRKVEIVKSIRVEEHDAKYCFENIKSDNQYVIDNLEMMKKEKGIWYCIELLTDDKSMIVMADGYPYAKFVAVRLEN